MGCIILVPWTGIESITPPVWAWSPNHWTTRIPPHMIFIDGICSHTFILSPDSCYYHWLCELALWKHLRVKSIYIYCFDLFDIFTHKFLLLQLCWSSSVLHFPCLHAHPNHFKTPELTGKFWKRWEYQTMTGLLRNLYAGQEATVRTVHGTTDWFQIGKGVW